MFNNILFPLVGIAIFLYGMLQLDAVVRRFFSVRVREYISRTVKQPIYGVIFGIAAAVLAQSSSAANILTIGMVGAGLISFTDSLGILLGAGIGTTVNSQLIALKITTIAPIFIIIGFILWFFTHDKKKAFGEMIFYFGLLFFGLNIVESAGEVFRHTPWLINLLTQAQAPLIGVLVGILFSIIVQASSIPIGLLVIFAQQGIVSLEAALPIVLGASLGTTIDLTAIIAGLSAKKGGQRVAVANFLFKFLALVITLPLLRSLISLIKSFTPLAGFQVALGHFAFALITTIIGLIILKPFSHFIIKILPGEAKVLPLWPQYLNKNYLDQPKIALDMTSQELCRMALVTKEMCQEATGLIIHYSKAEFRSVNYIELVVDNLQKEILTYLDLLSKRKMVKTESSQLLYYSIMVDDIERIADLSLNLAKLAKYQTRYGICLSPNAKHEIKDMIKITLDNVDDLVKLMNEPEISLSQKIIEREVKTDHLYTRYRQNHFERFFDGICRAEAGPLFVEMLVNLEKISDHCKNVAEYWQDLKEKYIS